MDQPQRFQFDVFVSASPPADSEVGWAPQLVQMLDAVLAQRLGRKPVIWYDKRLSGDDPGPEAHAQVLANSAVMVALVSPAYLASGWCRRELELFVRQAPPVEVGRLSRVFPVHLQPERNIDLPPALAQLTGYAAFHRDSNRLLLPAAPQDADARRQLMDMLSRLAQDIARVLQRLDRPLADGGAVLPTPAAVAQAAVRCAPAPPPSAAPATANRHRIFISYRREDSEHAVGRLADDLRQRFGADNQVFLDHASIVPGSDFFDSLQQALAECAAVLVVIGPGWLDAADRRQRRRLDLDDDWVRNEVAACLGDAGVRVFPVLVGGAGMPPADELPTPLQTLARRQALPLATRHWHADVAVLVRLLQQVPGLNG